MVQKIPAQKIDKDCALRIEDCATASGFTDYTAVVRGKWKLLRGNDASGTFTVVLIGPHAVTSNLVGIQILMAAGFSDVDAMLALGVARHEHKTWLKHQRARVRQSKAQARRTTATISLDDFFKEQP